MAKKAVSAQVEDSFAAIYKDLVETATVDMPEVVIRELGILLNNVLTVWPIRTGASAYGFYEAAKKLNVPIKVKGRPELYLLINGRWRKISDDPPGYGKSRSDYTEPPAGSKKQKLEWAFWNRVSWAVFVGAGMGKHRGKPWANVVKNEMKALRQRLGPVFAKCVKARQSKKRVPKHRKEAA